MVKAKKTQKNEKFPKLVKILGGVFLAMIALVILAPLFKEPATAHADSQELGTRAHGNSVGAQYSEHGSQYRDPFEELVATHPDPGVNTDFDRIIKEGSILISHNAQELATFGLVPKHMIPGFEALPEGTYIPVLNLHPNFPTGQRALDQLVIFHEYVHYRQWQDGSQPAETFVMQQSSSHDTQRNQCTKKWYAELDAYHQERAFARATGLEGQLDPRLNLSRIIAASEDDFQQALLEAVVRGDHSAAACKHVWESLVR